jgi:hypothetical protein
MNQILTRSGHRMSQEFGSGAKAAAAVAGLDFSMADWSGVSAGRTPCRVATAAELLFEFHRVPTHDGFVVLTCPDRISLCEAIVDDELMETLHVSSGGPISPLDICYGQRTAIAAGNLNMARKTGFTYSAGCLDQADLCRGSSLMMSR